jgi:hypothetical protein
MVTLTSVICVLVLGIQSTILVWMKLGRVVFILIYFF